MFAAAHESEMAHRAISLRREFWTQSRL